MIQIINSFFYAIFILAMGYYFITSLQWYSYKLNRAIFHHTKKWWHLIYFLIPFILYAYLDATSEYSFLLALAYTILLYTWYKKLDKPLVWTGRVKRFFGAMLLFAIFIAVVFEKFMLMIPIFLAYFVSFFLEMLLARGYKVKAEKKIEDMKNMKVIGITASYGKTSIKNILAHVLKAKYETYATPRSVNTLGGVMTDINNDLPDTTEVYVVEMGARGKGDIAEISTFVNPHYAIVGKIGSAHIEYFKSMENIRNTKMEILKSSRLEQAWVHESAKVKPEDNVHTFGEKLELDMRHNTPPPKYVISGIKATLDDTSFDLDGRRYTASILGEFNAINLAAVVLVAKELGLSDEQIQNQLSTLEPVAHRLQRIDAGGKVILDDSFNGNIDGMMASFKLVSAHKGRKVIITPGLVEVEEEFNVKVAQRANEVFDLVVLTGDLNYDIFKKYIDADKFLKLDSKSDMESMLADQTRAGDLILFANDAPSFI